MTVTEVNSVVCKQLFLCVARDDKKGPIVSVSSGCQNRVNGEHTGGSVGL